MKQAVSENDYTRHTQHPIGAHTGNLIWENIHVNRNPIQVVVELAQNALDENAKHLHIIVDAKRAILWAYDDGDGVTEEEILELWAKVGTSTKRTKSGKIGQKGIAKLANLAIAERNTFISRPKKRRPGSLYFKVVIEKSQFRDNEKPLLDLFGLKDGFGYGEAVSFKPTTLVRLDGLQKGALAKFANPQDTADEIGKAFATEIRRTGTDIQILYYPEGRKGPVTQAFARPKDYEGERQKPKQIKTPYGLVTFEMTTCRYPVKKPELVIDYQKPGAGVWSFDLKGVPGILDRGDIKEVLASGHFQGRITVGFCTLEPDRQGFIDDNERDAFVQAVLGYTFDWAKPYLAYLKSEANAEREEKILQQEEERLNDLFEKNPNLVLDGELRTFFPGGIPSKDKKEAPKKKKVRPTPPMEDVVRQPERKKPGEEKSKPDVKSPKRPPKNTPTKREKEEETHMGLRIVRKLANQEPRFSGPTWAKSGTIYFNVEHSYWISSAKKGDRQLAQYVHSNSCKELAAMMSGTGDRDREVFIEIFDENFSRLTTLTQE